MFICLYTDLYIIKLFSTRCMYFTYTLVPLIMHFILDTIKMYMHSKKLRIGRKNTVMYFILDFSQERSLIEKRLELVLKIQTNTEYKYRVPYVQIFYAVLLSVCINVQHVHKWCQPCVGLRPLESPTNYTQYLIFLHNFSESCRQVPG